MRTPPPPQDPTVALCPGTCGDPRGVGVSYERGTPVFISFSPCRGAAVPTNSPQSGRGPPFSTPLICSAGRWNSTACGTNRGDWFARNLRTGGTEDDARSYLTECIY